MKRRKAIKKDEPIKRRGEKLACAMQIPMASIMNLAHFELNGNREVVVDGCRGIIEYDENIIKLNKENAQTIILVTHSQNLANIANKKYILKNRELVVVE